MRPGYVRPGLSVDEAYRRWNMRLVRQRKKLYKERSLMVDRCPYCAENCEKVMVHGHYQCTNCGKNVTECCQGEMVDDESGTTDNCGSI
jgi:ribosomal protein L37AE/L43A